MASSGEKPTLLERARQQRLNQDGKSMWTWSNSSPFRFPRIDKIKADHEADLDGFTIVECWKYDIDDAASIPAIHDHQVKYLKEQEVTDWLEKPYPIQNERQLSAGLKLIHSFSTSSYFPFDERIIAAINDKFGLPAINLHTASMNTGACGRFISQGSDGIMPHHSHICFSNKNSDIHLQTRLRPKYNRYSYTARLRERHHRRLYSVWFCIRDPSCDARHSGTISSSEPSITNSNLNDRNDAGINPSGP
jgi:hypothetical protein